MKGQPGRHTPRLGERLRHGGELRGGEWPQQVLHHPLQDEQLLGAAGPGGGGLGLGISHWSSFVSHLEIGISRGCLVVLQPSITTERLECLATACPGYGYP